MTLRRLLALLCVLASFSLRAADFGITPAVGTLGAGAGVDFRLGEPFGIRVVGNTGDYDRDITEQDIEFNGKMNFNNYGAIADWYPGGGAFRLSAGVFSNRNRIDLRSSEEGTITVNGVAYPTAAVGFVTGDVRFNTTSPYVGIGWGRSPNRRWAITFDVGAIYQGSPKLSVEAHPTVPALVPASFYANLEAERAQTEKDISDYKYYPVVAIGLSFGF